MLPLTIYVYISGLYGEVSSFSSEYINGSQGTLAYLDVYVCECLCVGQYINGLSGPGC